MAAKRRTYDWTSSRTFYESGRSVRECMEFFAISKGAWYYAVKRGDLVLRNPGPSKPRNITRRSVEKLLAHGLSQAEIAARLGVSRPTVCFHVRQLGFQECLREFGFSRAAWYDAVARGAIEPRPRLEPIEQILAAGRRRNRYHVKTRLLLAHLKDARCEECGLDEWRSRPISLELHHVNGDGQDNRLENLMLLCPNCHSQTETWGARNRGTSR